MTLDELLASIEHMATEVGKQIPADDDWVFTLFSLGRSGVTVNAIPFKNEIEKDVAFAKVIPSILREEDATMAGTVSSAWTYGLKDLDRLKAAKSLEEAKAIIQQLGPPAKTPDRRELVMVMVADSTGKAQWAEAEIIRGGPHPTLTEWEHITGAEVQGRVPGPIIAALRANRLRRN